MKKTVKATELIFTEFSQDNLTSMIEFLKESGEVFSPVVCIETEEGLEIIDGHNRTAAAKELDMMVPVVYITETIFSELKEQGYDHMEIACGILTAEEEYEAAQNLNAQFGGARLLKKGDEVARIIWDMEE